MLNLLTHCYCQCEHAEVSVQLKAALTADSCFSQLVWFWCVGDVVLGYLCVNVVCVCVSLFSRIDEMKIIRR